MSRDVDIDRLKDSCFWFFLIRQIVFVDDANDIRDMYTQILPYLARRSANTKQNAEDSAKASYPVRLPVVRGDSSKLEMAFQAVRGVRAWSSSNITLSIYFNHLTFSFSITSLKLQA